MKRILIILAVLLIQANIAQAQEIKDSIDIKKGFTFGALPAIAYDSDVGFRYGALTNLYWFGDGTTYMRKRENERVNMFGETLNVYVGASVGSLREDFKPRVIDCWWSADWTQKCHLKQNFENLKC